MGNAQSQGYSVTFVPQNGALSVHKMKGNSQSSENWLPGDNTDLSQYLNAISQNTEAGKLQAPGVYPIETRNMSIKSVTNSVTFTSNTLPNISTIIIESPPARAVVYTNAQGVSNFCYINDPNKIIQLVPGGAVLQPQVQQSATQTSVQGTNMSECQRFKELQTKCSMTNDQGPSMTNGYPTTLTQAQMDLRKQIYDYLVAHSKTVPANTPNFNTKIVNIVTGCTIDANKQINLSGAPGGELSGQDFQNFVSTFNLPITLSQYDKLGAAVMNATSATINIQVCDGTTSNSQYVWLDSIAYILVTKYPPTSAPSPSIGTSGYVSFGSPYLSIGTGQPMWAYIVAIFAIIIALMLAKKSK